jgi:putative transposase
MRSRYRYVEDDAPYFLTATIIEWIPIFTHQKYFEIITRSLQFCRKNKNLKIHAYVILDNHLHLLVSGKNLSNIIRDFKSFTAQEIIATLQKSKKTWILQELAFFKRKHKENDKYQIWQEGSHPQMITSDAMLYQKIDYIHFNPVQRGLVREPEYWTYSSAVDYSENSPVMNGFVEIDFLGC